MTETITHIAAKQVGERAFQFYPISNHYRRSQLLGYRCTLISNEQICTNDIVEWGENQFVLGRMDNIINSGGIKLIPEKLKKIVR
jgi:O-succinylbenzoic acid--CoA ligase